MKNALRLFVLAITFTGCNNILKTNAIGQDSGLLEVGNSYTLNDYDSVVIASLESDSRLYDPELIIKPIDDSVIQYFVMHYDVIDTIKKHQFDYYIIKYKLKNSYIIVHEDVGKKEMSIITFLFNDKGLPLLKGIYVGDSLQKIKTLYNRNVLYGDTVSIIEESELAEINLFFRNDILKMIMYVDYESCDEFGLL